MKKKLRNFRQGEILLFQSSIKRGAQFQQMIKGNGWGPKADNVIAEGEISGHLHAITNGKLYEKNDKIVLEADAGCELTHPEHAPIPIPAGVYEIKIQEEYDEKEHRTNVKD